MTVDEARTLFSYTSWANARMFTAAEALTPEELDAPIPSSFPSVRATLSHLVDAEWMWLRRWLGEGDAADPLDWDRASLAELRSLLAVVEAERDAFLATLHDEDFEKVVHYRGGDGRAFAHPLGDLVHHVVNHGTYHRGQLVTLLRQLGKVPPATDFTRFLRGE